MPKLPVLKSNQLVKILNKLGFFCYCGANLIITLRKNHLTSLAIAREVRWFFMPDGDRRAPVPDCHREPTKNRPNGGQTLVKKYEGEIRFHPLVWKNVL